MKKTIMIVVGLMFGFNSANAMCVAMGDFFITNNNEALENLHVKYEKYKDAYSVSFEEKDKMNVEEFCKKISCTRVIKKMRGCSDLIIYTAQ